MAAVRSPHKVIGAVTACTLQAYDNEQCNEIADASGRCDQPRLARTPSDGCLAALRQPVHQTGRASGHLVLAYYHYRLQPYSSQRPRNATEVMEDSERWTVHPPGNGIGTFHLPFLDAVDFPPLDYAQQQFLSEYCNSNALYIPSSGDITTARARNLKIRAKFEAKTAIR